MRAGRCGNCLRQWQHRIDSRRNRQPGVLAFGIALRQWPLVVSNGVCLALSLFILVMTLLSPAKKEKVAEAVTGNKRKCAG